jgi:ribosomal protein S25
MSRLNRWLVLKGRKKKKTRKEKNQKGKKTKKKKKSPKETNGRFVAVLNHTRFERITFRSGVERATVAPAVLVEKIFAYSVLSIS